MDPWLIWILAAVGLGVLEVVTGGSLVFLMLAAGAAAGSAVAAIGAGTGWQFAAFAAVSVMALGVVRPVARRHLRQPFELRSGVAALVGRTAIVTESVDGRDGRIRLNGEIWSARSFDGQSAYAVGAEVQVLSIEGATALVAE